MERFFPADKILLTGNPVRQNLLSQQTTREEASKRFGLDPQKPTILILGGSLGARTLNHTLMDALELLKQHPETQLIWQTGRIYIDQVKQAIEQWAGSPLQQGHVDTLPGLYVADFLPDMASAYAAADLVVSRAGAGSISEFCLLGKPVILVPSPNVAEDHQTQNALALVKHDAALYVKDAEAHDSLIPLALQTVNDRDRLALLAQHIATLAQHHSAERIAQEVLKLIEE